jgi:multidrug efflux system membrane fusion protein
MNKNFKLSLYALAIFIVLVLGKKIFKSDSKNHAEDDFKIVKVLVQKAIPDKISATVELSGYIDAEHTITIVPQTDGVVKEIVATQGQRVNEGDVILIIDEKDKVLALKTAEKLVEQRKKELNISNSLLKTGDTPLTLNNQAKTAYEDAMTQLEKAKNQLDFTKVKATISGYVDKIEVKKGDYVDGRAIVAKILDDKSFIAVVSIPQSRIQTVDVGQKAIVSLSGKEINGKLTFVSNIADTKTKNYYGEINLDLDEKAKSLIIKMINTPVQVKISYNELPAIKSNDSITFLDDDGYLSIKTLNKDHVVTSIPVEILNTDNNGATWFYNENFHDNEEVDVIVRGGGFVNDGDKIESIDYVKDEEIKK